jgi:hypothetical protein
MTTRIYPVADAKARGRLPALWVCRPPRALGRREETPKNLADVTGGCTVVAYGHSLTLSRDSRL